MKTVGILNGPNLDRLGHREPEIYGKQSLADLEALLKQEAQALKVELLFFQSNHEGELIDTLNRWSQQKLSGIILNPAAYTHTSVALYDAVAASSVPVVEVHISNIYAREPFRQKSLTAPAAKALVSGMGFEGYCAALRFLVNKKS